jgi:hypothetical protein
MSSKNNLTEDQARAMHAKYYQSSFKIVQFQKPFSGLFSTDGDKFVVTRIQSSGGGEEIIFEASVVDMIDASYFGEFLGGSVVIHFRDEVPGLTRSRKTMKIVMGIIAVCTFGFGLLCYIFIRRLLYSCELEICLFSDPSLGASTVAPKESMKDFEGYIAKLKTAIFEKKWS